MVSDWPALLNGQAHNLAVGPFVLSLSVRISEDERRNLSRGAASRSSGGLRVRHFSRILGGRQLRNRRAS